MIRRKVETPAVDNSAITEAEVEKASAQVNKDTIVEDPNMMATRILRAARNADTTDALNGKIAQLKRQLARERSNGK